MRAGRAADGKIDLDTLQHIALALCAVLLPLWFVYVVLVIKKKLQRGGRGCKTVGRG
jgi:hypothetical protein